MSVQMIGQPKRRSLLVWVQCSSFDANIDNAVNFVLIAINSIGCNKLPLFLILVNHLYDFQHYNCAFYSLFGMSGRSSYIRFTKHFGVSGCISGSLLPSVGCPSWTTAPSGGNPSVTTSLLRMKASLFSLDCLNWWSTNTGSSIVFNLNHHNGVNNTFIKTHSHCDGNDKINQFFVSLPYWIHDNNANGKNGYHGDQLECPHCDGNGIEK